MVSRPLIELEAADHTVSGVEYQLLVSEVHFF